MCRWGALQLTSRLCRPQPGQDPWCWARWGGLGCRAGSVWLWWPGASPSPRPAAIDTPFRRGTRSGGREAARICILAGWSGSRLWRSSAICTDHLPRESKEDIVRERRDVWLETHAQRVCLLSSELTPFLPGMAHSQIIRFSVPSVFLNGLATKPCGEERENALARSHWATWDRNGGTQNLVEVKIDTEAATNKTEPHL